MEHPIVEWHVQNCMRNSLKGTDWKSLSTVTMRNESCLRNKTKKKQRNTTSALENWWFLQETRKQILFTGIDKNNIKKVKKSTSPFVHSIHCLFAMNTFPGILFQPVILFFTQHARVWAQRELFDYCTVKEVLFTNRLWKM